MAEVFTDQYATAHNLVARQSLWDHLTPPFRLADWVLGLIELSPALRILDVGCGNGRYLSICRDRRVYAVGCDLSFGMLQVADHAALVNADATSLPFASESFDVVLAPHMLYEVSNVRRALTEIRRVLKPGGVLMAVTNGAQHVRSLRVMIEASVRVSTPGWTLLDAPTRVFSLENGSPQLGELFSLVSCERPDRPLKAALKDAAVAADYVASQGDRYGPQISVPWGQIVSEVRRRVSKIIETEGAFMTMADVGTFICR